MTATVIKMHAGDKDAIKIGKRIAAAKESAIDTIKNYIEAGQILIEKKKELDHGNWLPWLKENEDVLGFEVQKNGCKTAERIMKLAKSNPTLTSDFNQVTKAEVSQINKGIWGNTEPAQKKGSQDKAASKPRGGGKGAEKYQKARLAIREIIATGQKLNTEKVSAEIDVSVDTVERAALAEQARVDVLEEFEVETETLALSAKAKLEIAKRVMERKLGLAHAARMKEVDEEVRQRVLKEGKEYVGRMKELEEKAWKDEKHWREMVNNHKPPYTIDQFKIILMCLHPDGERTSAKLSEAFKLFNSKKMQLTGEK